MIAGRAILNHRTGINQQARRCDRERGERSAAKPLALP
jgi:hypothetical protein